MRLLSWLLCVAAATGPVFTSEERSISRPKRDSSEKKIVCYYTNWSVYRPGTAKFSPQNINPYLCTHLIYAFGGLSKDNALKPFDKYQDIEQGGYAKFNGLKTYNKNLKTMLAIGGWNEGSARFSPLVADAERRKELVKNTVKFLRQNHFDGLDLDWEYPSFRDGGKPRDRDNYATLVQEFREEFERESEKTGRPRLLLTMAVPAGIEYIDKGYDVPKLNKYLDWMNILSYDYHSAFEPAINHHSPLFSLEEDNEYNFDAVLNIDHTVQHYLKLGAEKRKLVLGIPTYGRSYTLFNPDATDIGSPADGPGEQGEATREKGYLAYYEICERVGSGGWTLKNPNPEAMGPYAYKDNQWVGFDDEDIVRTKAKYVNDNDLGGIMFWSIDNDDFRGKCHGKPYPLIEAAKEALLATANELIPSTRSGSGRPNSKKQEQETSSKAKTRKSRLRTKSSTTTESSNGKPNGGRTSTTPQPPTTPDPGSDFVCKDEGFFPHPRDCKKYFWCLDSGPSSLGIVAHQFTCPSGLVFNKISDSCDYARNVICKTKSESPTTTTTTTSTTTTTTTTSRSTTARSRLVITASPPRTTSTTTTEPPEEEEEEAEEDEEDPGTIKELINLIKKLGGVEELEKQLNLQNSEGKEKIKPSLYSRVLQGRTANRYRGVTGETTTQRYVSVFRNRPVGPQSPSTEETSAAARGSDRPRYVTIQRNRSTKKPAKLEEEEVEEETEEDEEEPKEVGAKEETPRPFRRRPVADTTTEKEYVVLRRSRPQKEEEDISTPRYKNIVRVRSTTEAVVEEEEDEDLEEEEETVEEEKAEEIETGQKLKKYSSIIRDNKKVVAEEESKVSGPQGPQSDSGVSTSTIDSTLSGRDYVNNVNTVTSPRYVEIRRTQPTSTEPSENSVHSVYNSDDDNEERQTNEVYENQPESRENSVTGFQRRITTETVSRPIRPSLKSSTLTRTTPLTTETLSKQSRVTQRSTTEAIPTLSTNSVIQYKTLNRNVPQEKRLPKQEKTPKTTATEPTSFTEVPRRFQFAPRTKPAILSPKPLESTTEVFQITVPDLPSSTSTEKNTASSEFPSATLEPTTATSPAAGSIILTTPEDRMVLTTFGEKKSPFSTSKFIPTTSTQTSVVTSITESSFTERKRIFIPRKTHLKSESKYIEDPGTTEEPLTIARPYFRTSLNKNNFRSPVPRAETPAETTTETGKRRFKAKTTKTTTTTTEEPPPVKKYIPKKTLIFKQITSTETPEVTRSTAERVRFQPRNKPRHVEREGPRESGNSLQGRLGVTRRQKLFSKKEEDDLEVQQTATFFDNNFDSNDRYILGGAVKQTSEKDYLNADVLFRTVPTVEEEERLANKPDEDLTNSLNAGDKKEPIRNRLITINPALRNLRTRTRQQSESSSVTAPLPAKSSSQTTPRSNFFNSNFKTFRNRTGEGVRTVEGSISPETQALPETNTTESVRRVKVRKLRPTFRNRFPEPNENAQNEENKDADVEDGVSGFKSVKVPANNVYTASQPGAGRYRITGRTRQGKVIAKTPDDSNTAESGAEEPVRGFGGVRKTTESPKGTTDFQNVRTGRFKYRQPKENVSLKSTEETPTKAITTAAESSQRTAKKTVSSEGVTAYPSPTTAYTKLQSSFRNEIEQVTEDENSVYTSAYSPTFGTKIGTSIQPTGSPATSRTSGTIRGTFITVAPPVESSKTAKAKEVDRTTAPSLPNAAGEAVNLRARTRLNAEVSSRVLEKDETTTEQGRSLSKPQRVVRTRGKVKAVDSIFQATEGASVEKAVAEDKKGGGAVFLKKGRKVLVRSRPIQSAPEAREEENELEPSEDLPSTTSKTVSDKRGSQNNVYNVRTRGKSTTPPTPVGDRTERKRTLLDRRRFRGESRSTTLKPEVQTESSPSTSRPNILLQRRKPRPSSAALTSTATEEQHLEQQEDSKLEESKALDETPGIQDLADPAVVAIHNLATVSPGPLPSAVTASLNSYSQTPASYTVHVTPSDIASFSTPANPISATPGSVSSRPTSILTLKPYTIPLITRQYVTKQTPSPFRVASPVRETEIPVVTKEPYSPRSELLTQTRKSEVAQRTKSPATLVASPLQKETASKPRRLKPFSKVPKQEVVQSASSSERPVDYEYYDDNEDPLANIPASALKVKVHSDGYIECLDRGNFPHPFSCKKFISCAKMENNELLGWEYTCPKHLSFDPVGGICNWSAGLGCQH